jgi:hypothetical protein
LNGTSGRYFGIASDMPEIYVKNMPAFMPVLEPDKKTGVAKKLIWKKVRADHYWDLETMALVVAIREGFFPLAINTQKA